MRKHLFHRRRIEWISAAAIAGWGATFLLPGQTMGLSAVYAPLLAKLSENAWGVVCLCLGLARFTALIINGREPLGSPIIRFLSAVAGVWIWAHFAMAFSQSVYVLGAMSIGVPSALVFLAIDVLAARQSAVDAFLAWKQAKWRNRYSKFKIGSALAPLWGLCSRQFTRLRKPPPAIPPQ